MPWVRPSRPAMMRMLMALLMLATSVYTVSWLYGVHRTRTSFLGIDQIAVSEPRFGLLVRAVTPGSPAERAGLRPGDRLIAVNGHSIETFPRTVSYGRPGDRVRLTVDRASAPEPQVLEAVLARPSPAAGGPLATRIAIELTNLYPMLLYFGMVSVLLLRPDDRNARWMALLFAALIVSAPSMDSRLPTWLGRFSLAFAILLNGSLGGIFAVFFSVFPESSPLDRRSPRLKWIWLSTGAAMSAFLAAAYLVWGGWEPVLQRFAHSRLPLLPALSVHVYLGCGVGFVSLVWNGIGGGPTVRRKLRVVVWGTLLSAGPVFVVYGVAHVLGVDPLAGPIWSWTPTVLSAALFPLWFVYAVVRHRVLELPALLKHSARYLLVQRGSLGLLVLTGVAAAVFFSSAFGRSVSATRQTLAVGLGIGFGMLLVAAGTTLHRRIRMRIDRAFFRSAYDARRILEDLAESARGASHREDLGALLDQHVRSALLPARLTVYVRGADGTLRFMSGDAAPDALHTLPVSSPLLAGLVQRGQPQELAPGARDVDEAWISSLGAECLVPILGRNGRLTGLLALGPRLSEEPYSREDKRLLASVASQAGIALDSVQLAEEIADRLEAERSAAHELDLAQQVQAKLLPQEAPSLTTLELGGRCVQARAVGGDYFDFLELGSGRVGLVLADISGKGLSAALLMASLQASLRSRSGAELLDLPRLLSAVHHLLYRSSERNRFASLFLGLYDDATRCLIYANCGHNPPLLLRADGQLEQLEPTGPVLGLFASFECVTGRRTLEPGDLLTVYSDGITEVFDRSGDEFGVSGLLDALMAHREDAVRTLIDRVLDRVREFGGGEQQDDQTLLIARVR